MQQAAAIMDDLGITGIQQPGTTDIIWCKTDKQIAAALGINPSTLCNHLRKFRGLKTRLKKDTYGTAPECILGVHLEEELARNIKYLADHGFPVDWDQVCYQAKIIGEAHNIKGFYGSWGRYIINIYLYIVVILVME